MYRTNRPSRLTSEKIHLLDGIGFTWKVDKGCRRKLVPVPEKDREELVSIPKDAVITPTPEEVAAKYAAETGEQSSTRYNRNPRVLPQGHIIRLPRRVAENIKRRGGIRSESVQFLADNRKPETIGSSAISDTSSVRGSEDEHPIIARLRGASANGHQSTALRRYGNLSSQINENNFPILIATQNGLLPIGMTSQVSAFHSNSNVVPFSGPRQSIPAYSAIAALAARSNGGGQNHSAPVQGYGSATPMFYAPSAPNYRTAQASHISTRKRKDPPTAQDEE